MHYERIYERVSSLRVAEVVMGKHPDYYVAGIVSLNGQILVTMEREVSDKTDTVVAPVVVDDLPPEEVEEVPPVEDDDLSLDPSPAVNKRKGK